METQQELHKARPPVLPSFTCRKTITPHSPPPPGLENLVWTSVSGRENKGTRMRGKKSEKMWRRYSDPAFISASDTAKAAWLQLGREEKPTHFAAIKSSGPRLSEERGRTHCAGQRCDLSIQPKWPRLLWIWKTLQTWFLFVSNGLSRGGRKTLSWTS